MTVQTIDPSVRRVPPAGGFNTTVLRIELRRMLRNRRTIFFTLLFPAAMFLSFGSSDGWNADAERGRTVLFATHYLEEADQYADRIVLMRQGRIVADGTASQVKALAAGRTVRATMAHPDHRALARLDGVESVEVRGDTVLLHAKDTDAVARHLLTRTDARDLEITARGIEDAFLALTGDTDDDEEGVEA